MLALILFVCGLMLGGIAGIITMCIFQINKYRK